MTKIVNRSAHCRYNEVELCTPPPPLNILSSPGYDEAESLSNTAQVLQEKCQQLIVKWPVNEESLIIFVDDNSADATKTIINDLNMKDPRQLGGIKKHIHNRKHQNALHDGLMYALQSDCDAAISTDVDLQDDIGVLEKCIEEYLNGSQILYGARLTLVNDSYFKRSSAEVFYAVFRRLGVKIVPDYADYRFMRYAALQVLPAYSEVNLFFRGIVSILGSRSTKAYHERGERTAGKSKYPLVKMISFAVQGITSFSTRPLSFAFVGLCSFAIEFLMLIHATTPFFKGSVLFSWDLG